jgi:uncharacterized protein YyaL (SSP411 family)
MSNRERGGFYASQDADINLDDDGDYFTWTLAEASTALVAAEFSFADAEIALRYWGIREIGDMRHDPARNVLHLDQTLAELVAKTGKIEDELRSLLDSVRVALLKARAERPTPFIDRTLYTGWNAMAVTAFLEAARVLKNVTAREFALLTLDRLLRDAWDGEATLYHVIAYGENGAGKPAETAPGTLDDYAFTVTACLDAWAASGEMRYYQAAVTLAEAMIARFYDPSGGGFFDSAVQPGSAPLGALAARRKPLQDSPTPAGNPTAVSALLRLEALSGLKQYREIAAETLASFGGIVEHFGLYAGSYGLALERLLLDPVQVVILGSGSEAERMELLATSTLAVNKTVLRIDPERLLSGCLPNALAETLLQLPQPPGAEACAVVCLGRICLPPITDAKALIKAIGCAHP